MPSGEERADVADRLADQRLGEVAEEAAAVGRVADAARLHDVDGADLGHVHLGRLRRERRQAVVAEDLRRAATVSCSSQWIGMPLALSTFTVTRRSLSVMSPSTELGPRVEGDADRPDRRRRRAADR